MLGKARPTLRSLRDSGTIEQDGDVILLLYREDYFKYKDEGYTLTNELEIDVAKNKFGGPGVAKARFDGNSQTITDFESSQVVPW